MGYDYSSFRDEDSDSEFMQDIQKMREDAARTEMRRHFRDEARKAFKELQDEQDRLNQKYTPPSAKDIGVGLLVGVPAFLAMLFLGAFILFIGVTALIGLFTG